MPRKPQPGRRVYGRINCASVKHEVHGEFELTVLPLGHPFILSKRTGRAWTIGWKELIAMAIDAGITLPEGHDAA